MLGLGHDVVDVPAFAKQLNEPGTRMRNLFSMREIWQTAQRSQLKHDDEAVHLDDSHGVPRVVLSSEVQRKVQQSLGLPLDPVRQSYDISISISHDGPIASAVVMLEI